MPDYTDDSFAINRGSSNGRHDDATPLDPVDLLADSDVEAEPNAALVARRIRQIGPSHVLYGSDLSPPGGSIRSGWTIFRDRVPLTAGELRTIAGNVTRFVN